MRVPLLDLTRQHATCHEAVLGRVLPLFESQQFILGHAVEAFENAFTEMLGGGYAVGISSGTDAELAILMALDIGPGDAVITSPYTFFATAGCIHRVGAEAVFVDVEDSTLHMDPAKLEEYLSSLSRRDDSGYLLTSTGKRLRAILPIHLFGMACQMDRISDIAARYGLAVSEDAAQAVGTKYAGRDGIQNAGRLAASAWFSFFPTKNLGAAGDAGIAVCQDVEMANRLRRLRNHGMEERYYHREVGGNFRLDAIQAAVLHAKLPLLPAWNAQRRENARLYREAFQAHGLEEFVTPPLAPRSDLPESHTYHQYVIRAERRDALMAHLQQAGIGCAIYYPVPLHLQECFAALGYRQGHFPIAERAALQTLALPIFPELLPQEIEAVVTAIAGFYKG